MGRNVLITGACGFIGSNFVKYWRERYPDDVLIGLDVLTYASNKDWAAHDLDYFEIQDIADSEVVEEIIKEYKPDVCFHFAAESHVCRSIEGPELFLYSNIVGTANLIEAWRKILGNKGRFIHVSTDEVFGQLNSVQPPFNEHSNIKPRSPYAATKASSDLLVLAYAETYGFPGIVTNCSNNFGPFQHVEKLIPATIKRILQGKPVRIYGSGNQIRDWLFVDDHCQALETVLERGVVGQRYCIGGNRCLTNLEMVHNIFELMKDHGWTDQVELEIERTNDRPTDDFRYAVDSEKLESIGWAANSDAFLPNLTKTIAWHINYINQGGHDENNADS